MHMYTASSPQMSHTNDSFRESGERHCDGLVRMVTAALFLAEARIMALPEQLLEGMASIVRRYALFFLGGGLDRLVFLRLGFEV